MESNIYNYTIPNSGEDFNTLFEGKNIKIVRIVSSDNVEPQEYIQDEDEYVILLEGRATLEIDGKIKKLVSGDALLIPAKTPHKVLKTSKGALWLAVHIYWLFGRVSLFCRVFINCCVVIFFSVVLGI